MRHVLSRRIKTSRGLGNKARSGELAVPPCILDWQYRLRNLLVIQKRTICLKDDVDASYDARVGIAGVSRMNKESDLRIHYPPHHVPSKLEYFEFLEFLAGVIRQQQIEARVMVSPS